MPFVSRDGEEIPSGVLRALLVDAAEVLAKRGDSIAGKILAIIRGTVAETLGLTEAELETPKFGEEAQGEEAAPPVKRGSLSPDFLRRFNLN